VVKGNAEEETRIRQEIAVTNREIEEEYFKQQTDNANRRKKTLEEQKALELELIEIRRSVLEAERELIAFRAAQERKSLVNVAESAFGKARIEALIKLRDFDISEAEIEALYKQKALLSEAEFQEQLKAIRTGAQQQITEASPEVSILGGLLGKGEADVFKGIGEVVTATFDAMAQAAGSALKAFVLFGSAGGSLRKFAAEVIASIAQMAAVQAIWNLAEGFAKLALAYFGHPTAGASATQHFIAAGIYAGIAGIAAAVGRGVAGDSFKNQTAQGSFNQQTGGGGRSGSGNGGQVYTTNENTQVIDLNRNQSQQQEPILVVVDNRSSFGELLSIEIDKNGKFRDKLKKLAHG
jgi:hypothetical protein